MSMDWVARQITAKYRHGIKVPKTVNVIFGHRSGADVILDQIRHCSLTVDQIADEVDSSHTVVRGILKGLLSDGRVERRRVSGQDFWRVSGQPSSDSVPPAPERWG